MTVSIRKSPLVSQLRTDFPDHITFWSRVRTVYNVRGRGFGAAGDGVTDDYEAIWRAIQVAHEEGGGTVWLEEGYTYLVSQPFKFEGLSNVMVAGGRGSVVLVDPTWSDTSNLGNLFWITNGEDASLSHDIRVTGFTINGNRTGGANTRTAIQIQGDSYRVWVDNMYIYDFGSVGTGDCVYIGDRAENHDIFIRDNFFEDPGRSCVVVTGGVRVHIDNNIMYNWNNSAFDIEKNAAVVGPPDPNELTDILFTNNIMLNDSTTNSMIGITCDSDADTNRLGRVVVDGNIGVAGGVPLAAANSLESLIFTNNIFKTTGAATGNAYAFMGTTTARGAIDRLIFKNNVIIGSGTATTTNGVWLRSHGYAEICGNIITDMPGRGIITSGGSGLGLDYHTIIKDNIVIETASDGINSDSATIISGNVVRDVGGSGILPSGQGCVVANNYVRDTTTHGIFLNGTFQRAVGNYITLAGDRGIFMNQTNGKAVGNQIVSSTGVGIYMNAERCATLDNEIVAAGSNGIHCLSSRSRVIGNQIQNSTGVGIFANAARIIIANNRAFDNQGTATQTHGLQLGAAIDYLTVHGNEFNENGTAGWTGTTPTNYRPNPNGTFATDLADHNFI